MKAFTGRLLVALILAGLVGLPLAPRAAHADSCPYGCIYNEQVTLTGWSCHGGYIDLWWKWTFNVSGSVNAWEKSPGSGGTQYGPYAVHAPTWEFDESKANWIQGQQYTSEIWDSTGHSSGWQTVYSSGCPALPVHR